MHRRHSSAVVVAERQPILEKIKCVTTDDSRLCLYVLVLNGLTQNITIKWLLQLLEKPTAERGGEFDITRITDEKDINSEVDITFHLSVSNRRLNLSAEAIDLKQLRPKESSVCRMFRVNDFNIDAEDCLTISEKQRVMLFQIESLHVIEKGYLGSVFHIETHKIIPLQVQKSKDFQFLTNQANNILHDIYNLNPFELTLLLKCVCL